MCRLKMISKNPLTVVYYPLTKKGHMMCPYGRTDK